MRRARGTTCYGRLVMTLGVGQLIVSCIGPTGVAVRPCGVGAEPVALGACGQLTIRETMHPGFAKGARSPMTAPAAEPAAAEAAQAWLPISRSRMSAAVPFPRGRYAS